MSVFDMAREMGQEILKTDEVKRLLDAKDAYESDTKAVAMIEEYNTMQKGFQFRIDNGEEITDEERDAFVAQLSERGKQIQEYKVTVELMEAENAFNQYMNTVINLITSAMAEETNPGGCDCGSDGCDSGSCGSCSGCH